MDNTKNSRFNKPLPRGNAAHATLLLVIGGYIIYMGYQMIQNTINGSSTMNMTTTLILAAVMALVGLAVIGYAAFMYIQFRKRAQEDAQADDPAENSDECE